MQRRRFLVNAVLTSAALSVKSGRIAEVEPESDPPGAGAEQR